MFIARNKSVQCLSMKAWVTYFVTEQILLVHLMFPRMFWWWNYWTCSRRWFWITSIFAELCALCWYHARWLYNINQSLRVNHTHIISSRVLLYKYTYIPFKNIQWQVYFRPNYTFSVRKNLGVNYTYDRNSRHGSGSISSCPNFPFSRHNYTNVSLPLLMYINLPSSNLLF